jgi:hypothetical protein
LPKWRLSLANELRSFAFRANVLLASDIAK